jgi:hypothetical protein
MQRITWSEWTKLNLLDQVSIPPSSGVYQIRWAIDGNPLPISRANGTDDSGCLYIGKSVNLKNRLRKFRRGIQLGAEGRPTPNIHSGTYTYSFYDFARKFKPDQLECRYAELPRSEIDHTEGDLLLRYVQTHLDKPPLNISVKRMR